jgi:C1A family cysteine protease
MSSMDPGDKVAVRAVQAALEQSRARWRAETNFLTELGSDQRKLYLGFTPPAGTTLQALEERARQLAAVVPGVMSPTPAYPGSFDWRNRGGQNFVNPIRDQGSCGSCVAFGTTAAVEATARIQRNDPNLAIDLSEGSLFYCIGASRGRNCSNGWWPADALTGYRDTGVPDEACFPYTPGDQGCNQCADWQTRVTRITAFHAVGASSDLKLWISSHGPTPACMSVYDDFFSYSGGIYHHVTGNLAGGHCICIIGYDDAASCWICKNSWGSSWGESGFFQIAYGECGIESSVFAVDGIVNSSPPSGCLPSFLRFTPQL